VLGPKTFLAFIAGIVVGLLLVAPVIPEAVVGALAGLVDSGGAVIAVGVLALAVLMVLMAVLYQGYLKV
jgi:hypothetical protein